MDDWTSRNEHYNNYYNCILYFQETSGKNKIEHDKESMELLVQEMLMWRWAKSCSSVKQDLRIIILGYLEPLKNFQQNLIWK